MHEFIFSGISFQHYAIFDSKNDFKKINSKTGFQNQKLVFGFQTEQPESVSFRCRSLVSTSHKDWQPLKMLFTHITVKFLFLYCPAYIVGRCFN